MAAKTKVFSFEDQLDKMNELHGIPKEDGINVFSNFKKTMETLIGQEADDGTKSFEFQSPLGAFSFKWVEKQERINSTDGVKYTAPAHYVGGYAFPVAFMDTANKNVSFDSVPSSSDIAKSKAA